MTTAKKQTPLMIALKKYEACEDARIWAANERDRQSRKIRAKATTVRVLVC
jgi:hypothetical protein